jgi:hypothetical protein
MHKAQLPLRTTLARLRTQPFRVLVAVRGYAQNVVQDPMTGELTSLPDIDVVFLVLLAHPNLLNFPLTARKAHHREDTQPQSTSSSEDPRFRTHFREYSLVLQNAD